VVVRIEPVKLPLMTTSNASVQLLTTAGTKISIRDLKTIPLEILDSEQEVMEQSRAPNEQHIAGWMNDNAIFAYLFEATINGKTRVVSSAQTSYFMKEKHKTLKSLQKSRHDGEPEWKDTDLLLLPYSSNDNHWILMAASQKDFTVRCTVFTILMTE